MSNLITAVRSTGLQQMREVLEGQHARKIDVVASADRLTMVNGELVIDGVEPIMGMEGVTQVDGRYMPTGI